jgi:hypothetical protein
MSIHGLIAERILKRFVGRTLRRPRPIPTDVTGSEPDHDEAMSRRSDGPENKEVQERRNRRILKDG